MTPIGWRAWDHEGRVWNSRTSTVETLPREGLQIVVVYFDTDWAPGKPYRQILCGGDYLMWNGFNWVSTMTPPDCPTCRIFPGSWVSDAVFAELQARALAEETF